MEEESLFNIEVREVLFVFLRIWGSLKWFRLDPEVSNEIVLNAKNRHYF